MLRHQPAPLAAVAFQKMQILRFFCVTLAPFYVFRLPMITQLTPQQAQTLLQQRPDTLLLDVREEHETQIAKSRAARTSR